MDAKKSSTADEREYTQIKQKIRIAAKSAKNRLIDGILGVLFFAFLVFFCGYYWLPVLSLWPWQTPPYLRPSRRTPLRSFHERVGVQEPVGAEHSTWCQHFDVHLIRRCIVANDLNA